MAGSLYVYSELGGGAETGAFWQMFGRVLSGVASSDLLVMVPNDAVRKIFYASLSSFVGPGCLLPRCVTVHEWYLLAAGLLCFESSVYDRLLVQRALSDEALSLPANWQLSQFVNDFHRFWEDVAVYGLDYVRFRKSALAGSADLVELVLRRCFELANHYQVLTFRYVLCSLTSHAMPVDKGALFSDKSVFFYGFHSLFSREIFLLRSFMNRSGVYSMFLSRAFFESSLHEVANAALSALGDVSFVQDSRVDAVASVSLPQVDVLVFESRDDELLSALDWARGASDRAVLVPSVEFKKMFCDKFLYSNGLAVTYERVFLSKTAVGKFLVAMLDFCGQAWTAEQMADLMICFNVVRGVNVFNLSVLAQVDFYGRRPYEFASWQAVYKSSAVVGAPGQWADILTLLGFVSKLSSITSIEDWDSLMEEVCVFLGAGEELSVGQLNDRLFLSLRDMLVLAFSKGLIESSFSVRDILKHFVKGVFVECQKDEGVCLFTLDQLYWGHGYNLWIVGLDAFRPKALSSSILSERSRKEMGWRTADNAYDFMLYQLQILIGEAATGLRVSTFAGCEEGISRSMNFKFRFIKQGAWASSRARFQERDFVSSCEGSQEESVLSPSVMERYQRCPYRYYLQEKIGLLELGESTMDIQEYQWGSFVHKVLALGLGTHDFCSKSIKQRVMFHVKQELSLSNYDVWMHARVRYFCNEGAGLSSVCDILEELLIDWEPVAKELDLGPISLKNENGIATVAGKADLVLRHREHDWYAILDYKTGKTLPTNNDLLNMMHLQLPLYVLAAAETDALLSKIKGCTFAAAYILQLSRTKQSLKLILKNENINTKELMKKKGAQFRGVEWSTDYVQSVSDKTVEIKRCLQANSFPVSVDASQVNKRKDYCRFCSYRLICTWQHRWVESYG